MEAQPQVPFLCWEECTAASAVGLLSSQDSSHGLNINSWEDLEIHNGKQVASRMQGYFIFCVLVYVNKNTYHIIGRSFALIIGILIYFNNSGFLWNCIQKSIGTSLVVLVKNPPSNAGDAGLIPGWGTKDPHASRQLSLLHNYWAQSTLEPASPSRDQRQPNELKNKDQYIKRFRQGCYLNYTYFWLSR